MTKYILHNRANLEAILINLEFQHSENIFFQNAINKFRSPADDLSELVKYLTPDEIRKADIEIIEERYTFYIPRGTQTFFTSAETKSKVHPSCENDPDNYRSDGKPVTFNGISKLNVW